MDLFSLSLFALALFVNTASPGPSIAALVARVISHGARDVLPFIAAFWSWSGSLQSMEDSSYYAAIQYVTPKDYIISPATCAFVLGVHVVVGLLVAYIGCKRSRWD